MKYVIGTRGSKLALAQTNWVKQKLEKAYPLDTFEIAVIKTKGDRIQNIALDKMKDKGLFVKEIEQQLLDKRIDFAIHSLKDMPSEIPEGLCFCHAWECEDARDALILREATSFEKLKKNARIGTGSKRRAFQLQKLRSDIQCVGIRGNVDTRLQKMEIEQLDGIIMAVAGFSRLGLQDRISYIFSPEEMVPACGQGILAIECRKKDSALISKINALSDKKAMLRWEMERGFLKAMEGSCHVPIGAYLEDKNDYISFHCVYGNEDGTNLKQLHLNGSYQEKQGLLKQAVHNMKEHGKVYLVGGGPGRSDLLTLKGKALLEKADCILYDRLLENDMLLFAKEDCELIYVGKQAGNHAMKQEEINELLVKKAHQYACVVRLKGGDPYVFGRGGEEALYLKKQGIAFEVVPGVSSALAGLAYAGIPITHRGVAGGFHVVSAHDKKDALADIDFLSIAKSKDTCVFMMGLSKLNEIVDCLLACGKDAFTPIAVISHATWTSQKTVYGTLKDIKEKLIMTPLDSPALIVVGNVVSLHEELSFVEKQMLYGCRILYPRPHTTSSMTYKLKEKGAAVTELSTGQIHYFSKRLSALDYKNYNVLVCTSKHSAWALFQSLKENKQDIRALGNMKIYCVGSATAKIFEEHLIQVEVPEVFCADALSLFLKQKLKKEDSVLFLSGNMYSEHLYSVLLQGSALHHVIVYENEVCSVEEDIRIKDYDMLVFTCSSAVKACAKLLKQEEVPVIISIGEATTKTLKEAGITNIYTAPYSTFDGCIEKIEEVWRKQKDVL